MNDLKKLKIDYENINASEEFKESVLTKAKKRHRFSVFTKSVAAAAATFVFASVLALNVSPAFAKSVSEIPYLKEVVKVLTASRYEFSDGNMEAEIVTPKIEGLLDKELEDKLNNEFKENANAIILGFERDYKELKKEFGEGTDIHMGINYNYEVKTDDDDIYAIDIYLFTAAGSSSTKHSFYTIDKKTHSLLTLDGIFKDKSYVDVISEYIKKEMKRLNETEGGYFWVDSEFPEWNFTKIKEDQNFYINSDGKLVICFDKYDVAAGAQGSPEFVIPTEVISNILKPVTFIK